MIRLTGHLLDKDGVLLAMKGKALEAEMAQVSEKQITVIPIRVPGIDAERCLIKIESLTQAEVR
jgi:16S rRNA (guanine527-N7)-methyltransferase